MSLLQISIGDAQDRLGRAEQLVKSLSLALSQAKVVRDDARVVLNTVELQHAELKERN